MMHAAERRWSESRMRENRTSGSMRGCRKRASRNASVFYSTGPQVQRELLAKRVQYTLISTSRCLIQVDMFRPPCLSHRGWTRVRGKVVLLRA